MGNIFSWPVVLILLLFLTIVSFFLSASETSIIGLSKIRLRHMLSRGIKRAQSIQRLISKMDKFIVGLLVGNNFVNIAISSIVTGICVIIFGYKWGVIIATLVTTFFVLILCEITPKIIAIKYTERVALAIAPLMEIFIKILNPVIVVFSGISNFIIKLLRLKPAKKSPLITEEELRLMIELGKEEGFVSDEEGRMLQRIFEFGDTKVGDIMVEKDKIIGINVNTDVDELLDIFAEREHTRLPVYRTSLETIVGIIYASDLQYILRDKGLFVLQDLVNEAYFVPRDAKVNDILKKFQADKIQIAIVVDEHNRTLGMVTLEDLIEEIVGEIEEDPGRRVNHKQKV